MARVLAEYEAELFLKKYLPVAQSSLANNLPEADRTAKKLHFPVVLKIISKDALHKTEINGVRIVRNHDDLKSNFNDLMSISRKRKIKLDPDRPYGKLTFIKDDLPSPEELAESFRTKKITIDVEEVTLDFFKKKAEYSKSKYQRLMREVLKEYAKKYGT